MISLFPIWAFFVKLPFPIENSPDFLKQIVGRRRREHFLHYYRLKVYEKSPATEYAGKSRWWLQMMDNGRDFPILEANFLIFRPFSHVMMKQSLRFVIFDSIWMVYWERKTEAIIKLSDNGAGWFRKTVAIALPFHSKKMKRSVMRRLASLCVDEGIRRLETLIRASPWLFCPLQLFLFVIAASPLGEICCALWCCFTLKISPNKKNSWTGHFLK